MEIGETLIEAREAKNLSLDDIQEITKIQKRYLVAIEQNDFHALPGRFYARAFIKEYAQAVGLDSAQILAGFDEEDIQTKEEESIQYTRLEKSKRTKSSRNTSIFALFPSIIVIILVVAIIFIAWTLYQQTLLDKDASTGEPQSNDEIIRSIDEQETEDELADNLDQNTVEDDLDETEEELQREGTFSIVEVGSGSSPLSTVDFKYSEELVEVVFDVLDTTYVEMTGDSGKVFYAGTLEAGTELEAFDVSMEERIYFNIGNSLGLSVMINDVKLEYPVDTSESVHQKIWVNLMQD